MWRNLSTAILSAAIVIGPAFAPDATAATSELCERAINKIERRETALPEGVLRSIALIESGHRREEGGRWSPWPWTINSTVGSFYLDSHREAVAKVEELQRQGVTNIDVGCMQINLYHHPDAFRSIDEAFRPENNVAYAARYLKELMAADRDLFRAVGRYHSSTPQRRDAYARKVFARWGKDVDIQTASKHGLGEPDSTRIVTSSAAPLADRTPSGVWQGIYGDGARGTQLAQRSGAGSSWLRRSEELAPTMPRNAGQITFR